MGNCEATPQSSVPANNDIIKPVMDRNEQYQESQRNQLKSSNQPVNLFDQICSVDDDHLVQTYETMPNIDRQGIEDEMVLVITVITNPAESQTQQELYKNFANNIAQMNLRLVTIELTSKSTPFAVTQRNLQPFNFQFNSENELFLKYNLISIVLPKLQNLQWKYLAVIDYNVEFLNDNWFQEAEPLMEVYDMIQLFDRGFYSSDKKRNDIESKRGIVESINQFYYGNPNQEAGQNQDLLDKLNSQISGGAWMYSRKAIPLLANFGQIFVLGYHEVFLVFFCLNTIQDCIINWFSESIYQTNFERVFKSLYKENLKCSNIKGILLINQISQDYVDLQLQQSICHLKILLENGIEKNSNGIYSVNNKAIQNYIKGFKQYLL